MIKPQGGKSVLLFWVVGILSELEFIRGSKRRNTECAKYVEINKKLPNIEVLKQRTLRLGTLWHCLLVQYTKNIADKYTEFRLLILPAKATLQFLLFTFASAVFISAIITEESMAILVWGTNDTKYRWGKHGYISLRY